MILIGSPQLYEGSKSSIYEIQFRRQVMLMVLASDFLVGTGMLQIKFVPICVGYLIIFITMHVMYHIIISTMGSIPTEISMHIAYIYIYIYIKKRKVGIWNACKLCTELDAKALILVMTRCRASARPLHESLMARFTNPWPRMTKQLQ